MADEVKKEEPVKPEAQKKCVRCGYCESETVKPNTEDVKEFFRAVILGDRPYVKTYPLAGGQLLLTFSTMTAEETDIVNHFIVEAPQDNMALHEISIKTKLVYMLKEARSGESVKTFKSPDFTRESSIEDLLKEYKERVKGLDDAKLRMYCRTMLIFNESLQGLIAEAFDENFWKAAGPV